MRKHRISQGPRLRRHIAIPDIKPLEEITEMAREGKIDPVIGRKKKLRIIQIHKENKE